MLAASPMLSPLGLGLLNMKEPVKKPVLVKSPESSTESVGFRHRYEAIFTGTDITYQWYLDDTPIEGATSWHYSFLMNQEYHNKTFHCVATNEAGSVPSGKATLTLRHRIYLNLSLQEAVRSDGKLRITLSRDGRITAHSSMTDWWDTWIDPNLSKLPPFDISQYNCRVLSLPSGVTKTGGDIAINTWTQVKDGIYIELDISSLANEDTRHIVFCLQDRVMPNYNWSGWDNDQIFLKRNIGKPVITTQPINTAVYPTQNAVFTVTARE